MERERNSRPGKRGRKRFVCSVLTEQKKIDYKDIAKLRKCMTERSKILPRRVTGTCAYHQRERQALLRELVTLL